jgi:antagonist of KipI
MSLTVMRSGVMTTVQDLGRPGFQCHGVVVGGAADPFFARVANLLTGNPETAAVVEMALVGPDLRFEEETLIAWCGGEFHARVGLVEIPPNRPVRVHQGQVVSFGAVGRGARAWLAVAGGIEVPPVMGSRSTCRFGFGGYQGRPLMAGDHLALGTKAVWAQRMLAALHSKARLHADWSVRPESMGVPGALDQLRVLGGPERDWFRMDAFGRLSSATYRVTKDADRMGVRLEGPALELKAPREMISTAVGVGTIQVPPGGQPILLLCDRQTVGGYPRLAMVATVDHGRVAQLKQGDTVRFQEIDLIRAQELYLARESDFCRAREGVTRHLE